MRPDRALQRLGGVARTETLLRLTSRARLRVALARGLVVRDVRGSYSLPGVDEALRAASRLSGVLVEGSAAQYHGWELKHRPTVPCIAVPRNRKVDPVRRGGVRVRYLDLDPADIGGRVAGPGATVMHCAARLPFDEALSVADSALRHRDVTRGGLLRRAEAMPDRYRARCLRVAVHADARADNPFESVLRAIALDVPGLRVEPQVWVDDIGRPDLLDRGRRLVVEAESFEFHGRRRALTRDCERYNAFTLAGWVVVRFSWEHVMFEPAYVHDVLAAVVDARPLRRALLPEPAARPSVTEPAGPGDRTSERRHGSQEPGVPGPMTDKKLHKGDKVEWNSHGSTAEGTVEKQITSETEAGGRKVKASKDEPQYLVKSDKSGGEAVHKPGALRKK